MEVERLHLRLLLLLDELHRVGFEQLRFCRSYEGQHIRLQVYPAALSSSNEGIQWELEQQFTLSDGALHLWGMPEKQQRLTQEWQDLLAGDLAPKHLAGRWILDFADFARLGYGPDHTYRVWFRTLRPFLQQDYLPVTWHEADFIYATKPIEDGQPINLVRASHSNHGSDSVVHPAPPANPFVRIA